MMETPATRIESEVMDEVITQDWKFKNEALKKPLQAPVMALI